MINNFPPRNLYLMYLVIHRTRFLSYINVLKAHENHRWQPALLPKLLMSQMYMETRSKVGKLIFISSLLLH